MSESALEDCFPALPAGPADRSVSLDWWSKAHDEQLRLCTELESIADSLPANVNRQKCIYAAKTIGPLIKAVHRYEEDILFPVVEKMAIRTDELPKTIQRLKFEHFEDECFAEELSERLLALGAGTAEINMEATGYMLRGFFEALRRHIAFEREHLLRKMETAINAPPPMSGRH